MPGLYNCILNFEGKVSYIVCSCCLRAQHQTAHSKVKKFLQRQINSSLMIARAQEFTGDENFNSNTLNSSSEGTPITCSSENMYSFQKGSHSYYCLFISLIFPVCLFKSGAKSKGQVVTGLAGTGLGASSHLMWGRRERWAL